MICSRRTNKDCTEYSLVCGFAECSNTMRSVFQFSKCARFLVTPLSRELALVGAVVARQASA